MAFEKILVRAMHGIHLFRNPMTLGVRAAAFDEAGRIFLVRHTYVSGWHMPGGGVDPGETAEEGVVRELKEEGNLTVTGTLSLKAVYFNKKASNRDHVLFFHCDGVRQSEPKRPDTEIAESGFYALDDLPDDTTPATRRRLEELAGRSAIDAYW